MKVSNVIPVIYLSLLSMPVAISGQSPLQSACQGLKTIVFDEPFDPERIEAHKEKFMYALKKSTREEFNSCNCADTIWIAMLKDDRRYRKQTHMTVPDAGSTMRKLASEIDRMNLEREFEFQQLPSLLDSVHYVLDRMKAKDERRYTPEDNWRNFYHTIGAEASFLRDHKYQLLPEYLAIFDDEFQYFELRDRMINALFFSNERVETEILARIDDYIGSRFFFRMLGVLRTSGTSRSVEHLTNMLRVNAFDLNTTKAVLQAIYGITDRQKVERRARKQFENYLEETQLDTLSRYDLFIRD